ncbi:MAG: FG-GAP-like repeat-containing protein [Gammaproteobacteria bacterium]|nr:FG-GAP-like repeat-containing protein [Gammaproteobacteria bacterium]
MSVVALLAVLGYAGSAQVQATGSFEDVPGSFFPAVRYAVGANPFSVAEGDFNGDGKVDLVVGNWDSNNVSVLLGTGGGTFATAVNYNVGTGAQTVAVADFNGDQKPDLAVANIWSHNVSVLLGSGTGTFAASVQYPVGTNPRSVAIGDFNADGKPDLVVPNGSSGNISVLLGVGNGTFSAATSFQVGGGAISVAIGDFNADGKPDLAVANQQQNSVSILLGAGAGSFGTANNLAVGSEPTSVASGDFNADGKLDLAVTNVNGGNVSILIGTGTGTFNAASPVSAGVRPIFVAAGDLNGDGKPELAVANESGNTVSILLGGNSGVFGSATNLNTTGQGSRSVAIGDLNNDGLPDLVVVNAGGGDVSVLLGEFLPVLNIKAIGNTDATSSYALRKSTLWLNRQTQSPGNQNGWPFSHAAYADFNKDGRVDFVRTFADNTIRRPVQFVRNEGGGTFSDQTATMVSNAQPGVITTRKILIGDYNNDGWPDVFILNHGLDIPGAPGEFPQLFLSNGNGTLRYTPDLEPYPAFNHGGASGDIDGNGTVDVLVVNPRQPYFLINDGQGHLTRNFNRLPSEVVDNNTYSGELIDIDQDGFIDIVMGGFDDPNYSDSRTTIYWGSSSGYYRASNKLMLPPSIGWATVYDFAAEDVDGDGRRDLIINRTPTDPAATGRYFQILRQTAPRVFVDESATRISMNTTQEWIDYIRVQDLDGDGDLDIFIDDKDFVSKGDYAWINNGAGVFAPYTGLVTALVPAPALSITDVSVTEGNSGSKLLTFTVGLSSISQTPVTYNIATANGTATAGSDYVAKSLSGESIAAGLTGKTFSVTINGDMDTEANETFSVSVGNVVGASTSDGFAVATLLNEDDPMLSIADVSVAEGNSGSSLATFTVSLSKPVAGPVSFDIFTDYGTASPGSDFASNATIGQSIAAGQTSAAFTVAVYGDTIIENHEKFTVNLANAVGAGVADEQAQGRIINDDLAQLSIDDASVTEGNSGLSTATFVVRLSSPMPNPVTFDIATIAGTATAGSDYVARSQLGRFLDAGRTRQVFEVNINGDTGVEPNETFTVAITNVSGAALADGSAVGTISNDDVAALRASRASPPASSRGRARPTNCKPSTRKDAKPGAAAAGCAVPE